MKSFSPWQKEKILLPLSFFFFFFFMLVSGGVEKDEEVQFSGISVFSEKIVTKLATCGIL